MWGEFAALFTERRLPMDRRSVAFAVLVLLMVITTGAYTSLAQQPAAKVVEYGRYRVKVLGLPAAKDTSGNVRVVTSKDYTNIEKTKEIPCRVGESWGYRVVWLNLPRRSPYRFRTEMLHPPIKQPNGTVLTRAVHEITMEAAAAPPDVLINWVFVKGFEYELVPGQWTHKVYINDKEVVSMTFNVEK